MACLARESFEGFSLELHEDDEFWAISEVGIVVTLDVYGSAYERSAAVEKPVDDFFSHGVLREVLRQTGDCVICGEDNVKYQLEDSEFMLHEDCLDEFLRMVERFVSDNSDLIVGHEI